MGAYTKAIRDSHRIHGSLHLEILTVWLGNMTFRSKEKRMIGNVSDFFSTRENAPFNMKRRVWLGQNDVGFIMSSRNTGQKCLFILKEQKIVDGDLLYEVFEPYNPPESLVGWKFIVYND